MAESEEELKSLLMKVKEESEKSWLKTQHSENQDHGFSSHHFMANRWGNNGNWQTLFGRGPKSQQMVNAAMKLQVACSLEASMTKLDNILKSRDITLLTKDMTLLSSQNCGFSSSHVWMWELDHKESWVPKNLCFWSVVLVKTWEFLRVQGDQTDQF